MSNRRRAPGGTPPIQPRPIEIHSDGLVKEVSLEDIVIRRLAEANAQSFDVLLGATDEGDPRSFPANAGEFAARWNRWPPQRRENWLKAMIESSEIAIRCLQEHGR